MLISEVENCLSTHYLNHCGLFQGILQAKSYTNRRNGEGRKGKEGGAADIGCIHFSTAEKGCESV